MSRSAVPTGCRYNHGAADDSTPATERPADYSFPEMDKSSRATKQCEGSEHSIRHIVQVHNLSTSETCRQGVRDPCCCLLSRIVRLLDVTSIHPLREVPMLAAFPCRLVLRYSKFGLPLRQVFSFHSGCQRRITRSRSMVYVSLWNCAMSIRRRSSEYQVQRPRKCATFVFLLMLFSVILALCMPGPGLCQVSDDLQELMNMFNLVQPPQDSQDGCTYFKTVLQLVLMTQDCDDLSYLNNVGYHTRFGAAYLLSAVKPARDNCSPSSKHRNLGQEMMPPSTLQPQLRDPAQVVFEQTSYASSTPPMSDLNKDKEASFLWE